MNTYLKVLTFTSIFCVKCYVALCQVSDSELQKLSDTYLKTGDPSLPETIKGDAPGSKFDQFCQVYKLLDVNNKEGISISRRLIRDYPDFPEAYFALGTFMINGSKEYDSAIICLSKAIELRPEFVFAWFNRGIGKINANDYEGSIRDFDKVLQLDRSFTRAYMMRSVSHFLRQEYDAMLSDLEIALQMDPFILAELYYKQVRNTIDKAVELAPENVNLYYARGYANFKSGYYRLAVNDYVKALELVPGNSEYYKLSGACKIYLKDATGAESDLKVAMGINPDDPEIYYYLALLASDVNGQPEIGFEYLSRAIELNPYYEVYYYSRAWASYNLNDYPATFTDLEKAFEINDHNGDFYTLRALTVLFGELETGYNYCEDFKKAEELGTVYKVKKYINKYCKE